MVRLGTTGWWLMGLVPAVAAINNIIPGAFIVEYEDGANIDVELLSVAPLAETRMKLDFKLFKGASIRFHDQQMAQVHAARLVSTNPAVKKVWPVKTYSVPAHTVHWTAGEDASAGGDQTTMNQLRQASTDTFSPHVMTQVDRLRNQGIVGNGIKVAVIDTGVDYRHRDLGGCFGPGCLVSFGYDLVGDDFTGSNTPVPDPDPFDCSGHGTHVSGIIAAQGNNTYGIIGAATGVELGMFRVFGCDGSASNDVLIAAFNMAYEAGADIITASIGGASGWSEEPWAVAVSRIVQNGVPCTVSAGNDGTQGLFYSSTAANGKRVTSVASIDNLLSPSLLTNATYVVQAGAGSSQSFGYTPGSPAAWANISLPLFATSFNTSNPTDACSPLPANTPDLSGHIVLIRRGTCAFTQKLQNVANKGARYVLVYNNVAVGTTSIAAGNITKIQGVAMVVADQGAKWIAALATGQNVTVTMTDPKTAPKFLISPKNDVTGGYMSTYTSWGPTFEVDFKPQFGSPGGSILSTFPTVNGSYAVLSGTSMACPLLAGIYALLMNARGTKDPQTLENLLASTANPNIFNNGSASFPVLAPAAQQGAGLVQAYDAAFATTLLSVSSLSFNDTDNIATGQTFTISNTANRTVSYTLRNVGAAAGYTLAEGSISPAVFPNELHNDAASLTFNVENPLRLLAGERKIISVNCTPPATLDGRRLPVYSGYIVINGSDSSSLSLPYMGVVGSLKSATVMSTNGTYMTSSLSGPNTTSIAAGRTFLLPPPGRSNDTRFRSNITDYPRIQLNMAMGSPLVRIDVVPVSVPSGANMSISLGMQTMGDLYMTPLEYQQRNPPDAPVTTDWDGRLATGNYAPEGTYTMAVRALKIFGDRNNPNDYELIQMVEFGIRYMSNSSVPASMRRANAGARGRLVW